MSGVCCYKDDESISIHELETLLESEETTILKKEENLDPDLGEAYHQSWEVQNNGKTFKLEVYY